MSKKDDENFLRLLRETAKLAIQDIRLVESHCKLGDLKEGMLPSQATQTINLGVQIDAEGKLAAALASFKMTMAYEESGDGDPPVALGATFRLVYAFLKPASRKHRSDAIQKVAMLNVWPYWREFVQSMSTRMGLPPLPIPLINVVQLKLDEQGAETESVAVKEQVAFSPSVRRAPRQNG